MANSETTFADRQQRGREMQALTLTFVPTFAPADINLGPTPFNTFLDSLTTLNTTVATAEAVWKGNVAVRAGIVVDIKARALRASSRVKSNVLWKASVPAVKAAADNVRGYRVAKVKSPPDVTPPVLTAPRADQSYADFKGLLDKLIAALNVVSGYSTGAPGDLTVLSLTALSTSLDTSNKLVAANEATLTAARAPRLAAYDAADTGLRAKMQAIKEATKSQYGSQSAQFQQIKGIKG